MLSYKEKVEQILNLLISLSSPKSRKQPYDLKIIAESLLQKYDPNKIIKPKSKNLAINFTPSYGRRDKAYSSIYYWEQKILNNCFSQFDKILKS